MTIEIGSFRFDRLRVHVTERCNLKCSYCFNENHKSEIALSSFQRLYDSAIRAGLKEINISGGEPFLHPDIVEIIRYIDIPYTIYSNGIVFAGNSSENIFNLISNSNLKHIQVSLDGLGSNKESRGIDSKIILKGIERLLSNNISCVVATTITIHNIDEILDLHDVLSRAGVSSWRIATMFPAKYSDLDLHDYYNFKKLVEIINTLFTYNCSLSNKMRISINGYFKNKRGPSVDGNLNFDAIRNFYGEKSNCSSCTTSLTIKSNGEILICDALSDYAMGNAYEFNWDLHQILEGNDVVRQNIIDFDQTKLNETCISCKYLLICRGGCSANSLYWNKNIADIDPVACKLMKCSSKIVKFLGYDEYIDHTKD